MRTKLALGAVLLAGAIAAGGCSDGAAQDRITIADPPHDSVVEGAWQSSAWFSTLTAPEPWLSFPATSTVRVHHTLGRTPVSVDLYIAPDAEANPDAEFGAGATTPAGDQAKFIDVNAMYVEVQNTVDTPYFMRIVLR